MTGHGHFKNLNDAYQLVVVTNSNKNISTPGHVIIRFQMIESN